MTSHKLNTSCRPTALCRSWLFTSGSDRAAQAEAAASGADAIVVDLEEFTAPSDRVVARPLTVKYLAQCRERGTVAAVRINRLKNDGLDDLYGVMPGMPDVVFLPYVETAEEILELADLLQKLEAQNNLCSSSTQIVPTIESALGFIRIQAILTASPRVQACLLAAEDLTADLGAERGPDSLELNHLRSRFHVECTAAGVLGIDCPFNYRDSLAQKADLLWARRIGLRSKCTVYPQQVNQIHEIFTPSDDQVQAAAELVARFEAARHKGQQGDDSIESPDYNTARRLLARDAEFRAWSLKKPLN